MSSKPEDNMGLAFHISKKFFVGNGGDVEDSEIYSDALFGLVRASKSFKPDFDVAFSTYAWRAIRNEIIRGLGKKAKYESKLENDEIDLFELPKEPSKEVLNPKVIPHILKMIFKLKYNKKNKRFNEKFDVKMKILIEYYILKKSSEEIAKTYGITRSGVQHRIKSGIEEIKKHPKFKEINNKFENSFIS